MVTRTQNGAREPLDQRPDVGRRVLAPSPGTTWQGSSVFLQELLSPVASAADSPVLPNLAPGAGSGMAADRLLALAEQRRHRRLMEEGHDGVIQIGEGGSPLLGARGQHGPNPFAPPPARLPPGALRDMAVAHHQAERLFLPAVPC